MKCIKSVFLIILAALLLTALAIVFELTVLQVKLLGIVSVVALLFYYFEVPNTKIIEVKRFKKVKNPKPKK
ncbi:hypothetical protein VCHA29O37_160052 [Vibrio chagasii]|nr:hypothetical protein VCHA29O37_160052 [Vibrio chagasii]